MFGNVAAFVNGNMFMGVFGADVGLKLPPAELEALRAAGGQPFGPAERPMGGYICLPAGYTHSQAEPWVRKALTYVAAQPPKAKKTTK
jgi:TfoX/Sxy family transcriptional regulator of competence genes